MGIRSQTDDAVERAFRDAHGTAVAALARVFGDISLAEDAVQDAFAAALDRWPKAGIPTNPVGWIVTTARNRALDTLRRDVRARELYEQVAAASSTHLELGRKEVEIMQDDQLRLIFTCCHPALRVEHQVALTLRLVGGLAVDEVARGFLVSEATMAKRLVRAKYKIKAAGIPLRVPDDADLPARLRAVLAVLYLIYNAGADDPSRADLRAEAIRLAGVLAGLMPDEPEAIGLLALMLLCEARQPARDDDGEIVQLRDQDRTRWNTSLMNEGHRLVRQCMRRDQPGPFQVQAAIHAVHCQARTFAETDWEQILALYDHLHALMPTPVVAMNRAIARAETATAEEALTELDALSDDLSDYHLLHASRATMLRRLGRRPEAVAAFEEAIKLAPGARERMFLRRQTAELIAADDAISQRDAPRSSPVVHEDQASRGNS